MRLVKEFESGAVALLGLLYGFCLGQVAHCLFCFQFLHIPPFVSANLRRPSESFRSPALPQEIVPTVSGSKPAVEEVVTRLAGNLEADVTETLSRDNGLLTLAANGDCPEFHRSPPQPCLFFLVGQFVSERFQILVGFVQTRANLVDRAEHRQVVDSDIRTLWAEAWGRGRTFVAHRSDKLVSPSGKGLNI